MSWTELPPIPAVLVWVLILHLAAWALGSSAWRRARGSLEGLQDTVIAMALGMAFLAHAALGLALVGLVRVGLIRTILLLLALLGAWLLYHHPPKLTDGPDFEDLPALLAALFFASFLPRALEPVLRHDDNTYHLYLPRRYLETGELLDIPSLLYANMPHLSEVFYTLPMASGGVTAPGLLVFSLVGWTLLGIWSFAAARCGRLGAGIVLVAYVADKSLQWHLGSAYVEPLLGFFLLGAALCLVRWSESECRGTAPLVVGGFLAGSAAAGKYTAWLFAGALGLAGLVLIRRCAASRRTRLAVLWVASAAAPVLPWLLVLGHRTGNPLYPTLYSRLGGREWSEIVDYQYRIAPQTMDRSAGWSELLAAPWNLTVGDDYYSAPSFSLSLMLLFLASIALALWGSASGRDRWLPPAAATGFALWALTLTQGRYLLAWAPVMALAAVLPLGPLRNRRPLLATLAVLAIGIGAVQLVTQRYPYRPGWREAVRPRVERLSANHNFELARLLGDLVPPDGKVLVLWDNRMFFLDREFRADSAYHAPQGLARLREAGDPEAFASRLRQEGFTHVVIHGGQMLRYFDQRYPWSLTHPIHYPEDLLERDRKLLRRFVARELEPVRELGPHGIFRLAEPPSRPSTPETP